MLYKYQYYIIIVLLDETLIQKALKVVTIIETFLKKNEKKEENKIK